jgi:hypothetical protein
MGGQPQYASQPPQQTDGIVVNEEIGGIVESGVPRRKSNHNNQTNNNSPGEKYYVRDHDDIYQGHPPFMKAEFLALSDDDLRNSHGQNNG